MADDERQSEVRGLLVENQTFLRAIAILRCNGTQLDADDIVQLTNRRVLECWYQWRGEAFKAWLREIMISQFRREMRRERLRTGVDLSEDAWARIEDENPSGGADAVVAGLDFNKTLARLSPDHQEILLLRMEGLSYEQLAEALEIPKGTAMSRLKRARDSFEQHRLDLDHDREEAGS